MENTFNKFTLFQTINDYNHCIYLLKDNRIASGSDSGKILIYNPSKNYIRDQTINTPLYSNITSICQLDNGTIVSGSNDKSICIGDYVIKQAHDSYIYQVIAISNNRIASSSADCRLKIWNGESPSETPIKVLLQKEIMPVVSIFYLKEKDFLLSCSKNLILRVWNMSTYQLVTVMTDAYCLDINGMYQIDKKRMIIGYLNSFYILNIDSFKVEKVEYNMDLGNVNCFLKLRDNKTIFCGGSFICDINSKKYQIKKYDDEDHKSDIRYIMRIDDRTFITCNADKVIHIWKY